MPKKLFLLAFVIIFSLTTLGCTQSNVDNFDLKNHDINKVKIENVGEVKIVNDEVLINELANTFSTIEKLETAPKNTNGYIYDIDIYYENGRIENIKILPHAIKNNNIWYWGDELIIEKIDHFYKAI